jgi:hypothetical protein
MRADIAGAADDKNRFTCHAPPLFFTRDGRNLDEIHVNKKKELRSPSTDNTSNAEATLDRVRSAACAFVPDQKETGIIRVICITARSNALAPPCDDQRSAAISQGERE